MPDKHGSAWSPLRASYLSPGLITRLDAAFILIVITHFHDSIIPSSYGTYRIRCYLYSLHSALSTSSTPAGHEYLPASVGCTYRFPVEFRPYDFGPTTNAYTFGCWSTSLDRVSMRLRVWRTPSLIDTLTTRDRLPSALWQTSNLGSPNPSFNTGRSYTYLT